MISLQSERKEINMNIPVDKYIEHALQFKPEEEKLRDEFEQWLPNQIIDCHAHCNRKEDVITVSEKALSTCLSNTTACSGY